MSGLTLYCIPLGRTFAYMPHTYNSQGNGLLNGQFVMFVRMVGSVYVTLLAQWLCWPSSEPCIEPSMFLAYPAIRISIYKLHDRETVEIYFAPEPSPRPTTARWGNIMSDPTASARFTDNNKSPLAARSIDAAAVLCGHTSMLFADFGRSEGIRYAVCTLCFFQKKQITVYFIGQGPYAWSTDNL